MFLKKISAFIKLLRVPTLIVSIAPVFWTFLYYLYYRTNLSPQDIADSTLIAINILISALLVQILSNVANDYYDFQQNTDQDRLGSSKVLDEKTLSFTFVKLFFRLLIFLTIFASLPLVVIGGWPILLVGIFALSLAVLYSKQKIGLAYNYLAEIAVVLFFGILPASCTYYIIAGQLNLIAILLGVCFGSSAFTLLGINNIRDYQGDKKVKRRNLIILFGQHRGLQICQLVMLLPVLIICTLCSLKTLPAIFLLLILPSLIFYINSQNIKDCLSLDLSETDQKTLYIQKFKQVFKEFCLSNVAPLIIVLLFKLI